MFIVSAQSSAWPLLTLLVLGVLVAVNPCQLAISMSALTYFSRKEGKVSVRCAGLFVLGKALTYLVLGLLIVWVIPGDVWQRVMTHFELVERAMPYAMFLIALFFLFRGLRHHHHHDTSCHNSGRIIQRRGRFGALGLGVVLALLFCPESAVVYFGMAIPVCTAASSWAPLYLLVFAVGTALPVLALACLMRVANAKARRFEHRMEHVQQWINIFTALLFTVVGIWLLMNG